MFIRFTGGRLAVDRVWGRGASAMLLACRGYARRAQPTLESGAAAAHGARVSAPPPDQDHWFAEHLRPHEAMLRAWLASRFPGLTEIDDILQESYAHVLAARARGTEMQSPKAFLFATARNRVVDLVRFRASRRTESLAETDALHVLDEVDGIPETVARNSNRRDLDPHRRARRAPQRSRRSARGSAGRTPASSSAPTTSPPSTSRSPSPTARRIPPPSPTATSPSSPAISTPTTASPAVGSRTSASAPASNTSAAKPSAIAAATRSSTPPIRSPPSTTPASTPAHVFTCPATRR